MRHSLQQLLANLCLSNEFIKHVIELGMSGFRNSFHKRFTNERLSGYLKTFYDVSNLKLGFITRWTFRYFSRNLRKLRMRSMNRIPGIDLNWNTSIFQLCPHHRSGNETWLRYREWWHFHRRCKSADLSLFVEMAHLFAARTAFALNLEGTLDWEYRKLPI